MTFLQRLERHFGVPIDGRDLVIGPPAAVLVIAGLIAGMALLVAVVPAK